MTSVTSEVRVERAVENSVRLLGLCAFRGPHLGILVHSLTSPNRGAKGGMHRRNAKVTQRRSHLSKPASCLAAIHNASEGHTATLCPCAAATFLLLKNALQGTLVTEGARQGGFDNESFVKSRYVKRRERGRGREEKRAQELLWAPGEPR